ncbi:MAG TPA: hypothetical protein VJ810_10770 [Blastocatellia bacterium]|nr:hypothetical protein [Blastocatellia bacterium]
MADIKRMRYFDQQLLVLKDFTDEQNYHVEMRRLHNRSLHSPGVASGLDVTKTGAKEVTVKAGMAIDNLGREIALDADTKIDLSNASLFPASSSVLVTISYAEEQTDPWASDPTQNTRIKEKSNLVAIKEASGSPPDSSAVQLARVVLDAQANVGSLDLSVRKQAGASAFDNPDANLTARSLRLSHPAYPNTQWPTLAASGSNEVTFSGLFVAQSLVATANIKLNGSLIAGGDLSVNGALSAPNATIKGDLSVNGSLVIGTGNPQAKLQVAAGAIVPSVGNSAQAGIQFPPNPGGGSGDEAFIRYFVTTGEATKLQIGIANDLNDAIGLAQGGAERLTIINGNVGIGTPNPDALLRVKQGASALALKVTANRTEKDAFMQPIAEFKHDNETQGVGIGYSTVYATGSNADQTLSVFARGKGSLLLNVDGGGNVGIGVINPTLKLDVGDRMRVRGGASGPAGLFFTGSAGTDQAFAGLSDDNRVGFWGSKPGFGLLMNVTNGNVGIGVKDATLKLDVGDRMRVRGGASGPAGLFFTNSEGVDLGLAGLADDNHVGFWGLKSGWGLLMNVTNGYVGIGTAPSRPLDVKAASGGIKLGLEGSGGGQLILGNNPNDNKIFLEAFSSDGNGHAAELALTGRFAKSAPQITLMADNTTVTGTLRVNGVFTAAGGKVGYVVDQFINKLGETVEEGDVVVIGQNQSMLFYGQHENIPIPEIDLAESAYQTGVCGIVCETHGELRQQPEGDEGGKAKGARKTKKPVIAPQAFTLEEMEKQERTQVQPGQIGLMVTLGAFAHCKVDADIAPIKVGDLLTTSPTKGHAQKVLDPGKAVGAIIGKALGSLKKGKSKIPVLVMLQ